jgi:hypothetical protein
VIGRLRLLLAAFVLCAAAPQPVLNVDRVPNGPPTVVMKHYLEAIQRKDYPRAFALLDPTQRAYYRNAQNFSTVFTADDLALRSFNVFGTRHDKRGYAYFVNENVSLRDYATAATITHDISAVYGVFPIGGGAYGVRDSTYPWRQVVPGTSATVDNLKVTVQRLEFYERRIEAVVTFTNVGTESVTLLPYKKTVLSDDAGDEFRPIETDDWRLTDKRLFLEPRLGPNSRVTGILNFQTARLDDKPRTFSLTVGPNLREGGDEPFAVTISGIKG